MNKLESLSLLFSLLWASLVAPTVESINTLIEIDWDMLENLDYRSAVVGDTVSFTWNGTQRIFIQNTEDGCNATDAIDITQDVSEPPANYTFKPDEVYSEIFFSSTIDANDCFVNETLVFSVQPSVDERPTNCNDQKEALEECMEDNGARGPKELACELCISAAVAGTTIGLGLQGCLGDSERVCESFVNCFCTGCYFEAAALGSCHVDRDRGDECAITDCSEQVAEASPAFLIAQIFPSGAFMGLTMTMMMMMMM